MPEPTEEGPESVLQKLFQKGVLKILAQFFREPQLTKTQIRDRSALDKKDVETHLKFLIQLGFVHYLANYRIYQIDMNNLGVRTVKLLLDIFESRYALVFPSGSARPPEPPLATLLTNFASHVPDGRYQYVLGEKGDPPNKEVFQQSQGTFRILLQLRHHPEGLTFSQIKELVHHKESAARFCDFLLQIQFIEKFPVGQKTYYRLNEKDEKARYVAELLDSWPRILSEATQETPLAPPE